MSEPFYVPIYSTDTATVIPDGQRIVYSTLCKITNMGKYKRSKISAGLAWARAKNWETHVLFTDRGFALENRNLVDESNNPTLVFVPYGSRTGMMGRMITYDFIYHITLEPNPDEDKKEFKLREKKFPIYVLPYMANGVAFFLNSPEGMALKGLGRKGWELAVNRYQKEYQKLVDRYGMT